MGETTQVEYNGVVFESIAELARYVGLKPVTLRTRLRKGMSIDDAVKNMDLRCKEIVFNGKVYSSIKVLCDEAGISEEIVRCRLSRGDSIEEAITKEISITKQGKPGIYHGIPYKSIKSLSDKLGIEESKMRRELKR